LRVLDWPWQGHRNRLRPLAIRPREVGGRVPTTAVVVVLPRLVLVVLHKAPYVRLATPSWDFVGAVLVAVGTRARNVGRTQMDPSAIASMTTWLRVQANNAVLDARLHDECTKRLKAIVPMGVSISKCHRSA